MESKTKRLLLIGGSILVIGGVVYYFYNQKKKKNDKLDDADDSVVDESKPGVVPISIPTIVTPAANFPSEFNNSANVTKFQDFMDSIGPWVKGSDGKYKKLNKGAGYGNAGPATLGAFSVYGDLFRVFLRSGDKGKVIPIIGTSPASVDVGLSNGTIARYQADKKFVHFASAYGSVNNTGTWTNGGRKIVLTFGPKKGTIDKPNIWEALKALIS